MKRRMIVLSLVLCLVLLCSFQVEPNATHLVAEATTETDSSQVLSARFLNMLNHNQAYGEDFYDTETLTERSVVSLLDRREDADSAFIDATFVQDYLLSMYGVEKSDFSDFQTDWPQKEGYVYIIPRGYTEYDHELVSAVRNEDGSYTVVTDVTVTAHDGEAQSFEGVSLFLENSESPLGYQLISAELFEKSVA